MPIIRDGEKYACKQCIQGHRVSGCNHVDRPLQHVNKKGRPVSQCPHCRGLRRSRQSHIKCECGERRHSRNASSESAATSLADDDGSCKCGFGKKCICNLKKEVTDADPTHGLPGMSPQNQRSSPMRWIPPRRSESAVPRFRNAYQPHNFRNSFGATDLGMLGQAGRPYQLGARHIGQRSVDSLPLTSSSSAQYQAPMTNPSYDHQFLNPDYAVQQQLPLPPAPMVGSNEQMSSEFPIRLDQTTIDKTLSPHNTKRYSMNDFSMLAGMSHPVTDQQLFPNSAASEPQPLTFPEHSAHDFAFPVFGASAAQNPPPMSVASTEFTFPALSRSSSGTTSEQGDSIFMNQLANSSQPLITIDPSWSFQQNYEGSEKSANFEFTTVSYHDTPSEYASPFEDPALPVYDYEGGNNGVNPFSTEPPSGGLNNFPTPGTDYSPRDDFAGRGLPDRSAGNFNSSPQMGLGLDFRFPNDDIATSETYGSPLRQGWSPMTDATAYSIETEVTN